MYFTRNICTTLLYYYSLMIVQETKLGLRLFHGLQQWNLFCPSFDLCLKAYQEEAKTERREGTVVKGTKSNSRNSQKKKSWGTEDSVTSTAKADVFTNNKHGEGHPLQSLLCQPESDAELYWKVQYLNGFEQLVSGAWHKEWLSQDIKAWPYRLSLDTAYFPPPLPHGCANTYSHVSTKYMHRKKPQHRKTKKPNNKILENQDQYSGVFAQSSKVVWPQVTKAPGKDLRLEKKQQCKQLA